MRQAVTEYAAQRELSTRRPYEAFAPFIGIISSGHGTLSENTGERFAEAMKARRRGRRSR